MGSHTVEVEPVTKFAYFGSDIYSDGYFIVEMHRRLGLANSIMGQLDGVWVWKQQKLSLDTKLCLYSSLVLAAFLYGSETWVMRKVDSEKIQAFHMTSQRRILCIKWLDHVKNSAVSKKTGLKDLPLIIIDRRHSLFGHICRLSPECPRTTPCNSALTLLVESFLHQIGGGHLADHAERGSSKRRRTWSYLWAQLGLQPWIGQRGVRYNPQLVMRSSEWVSYYACSLLYLDGLFCFTW